MNDPARFLQRLAAAARHEDASPADELPVGLATRVLARLRERPAPSMWESFALAALPVAALVTLVCVLLGPPLPEPPDEVEMISNLMLETQLPTLLEP
jgi:hypothetical protein